MTTAFYDEGNNDLFKFDPRDLLASIFYSAVEDAIYAPRDSEEFRDAIDWLNFADAPISLYDVLAYNYCSGGSNTDDEIISILTRNEEQLDKIQTLLEDGGEI